jgi:hypothetical protein
MAMKHKLTKREIEETMLCLVMNATNLAAEKLYERGMRETLI